MEEDKLLTNFDHGRTFLTNTGKISSQIALKNILGLALFILIFAVCIPYILIKKTNYVIASLYFSNLDIIAAVIGFSGGPYNIWKYLYNPSALTTLGWSLSNFINLLALIGVAYVCISYAIQKSQMIAGLAMFIIIIPITYLLPSNFIIYAMNKFAKYLHKNKYSHYVKWVLSLITGFIMVIFIIFLEKVVIINLLPYLTKLLENLVKMY